MTHEKDFDFTHHALNAGVDEMYDAEPIRGAPVDVLTSGRAIPLSPGELREIGVDSRQVIAEQSSHWVHMDEPTLVIDTIVWLAVDCRCPGHSQRFNRKRM